MKRENKPGNVPGSGIDLSAGFVPKTTPGALEKTQAAPPQVVENAAADFSDVDEFVANALAKGAVPESPVAPVGSEPQPSDGKPAEITWRWAAESDMPALQALHFQAEIASGQAMYLHEGPSGIRSMFAVAEKNGQIIGGVVAEDAVAVTLIGMDPEVLESAGEVIIPLFVDVARKQGTRFLHIWLPSQLARNLDAAFQKAGFKSLGGTQYRLDAGVEDSSSAKRKVQ